jgi:hypothetical protein
MIMYAKRTSNPIKNEKAFAFDNNDVMSSFPRLVLSMDSKADGKATDFPKINPKVTVTEGWRATFSKGNFSLDGTMSKNQGVFKENKGEWNVKATNGAVDFVITKGKAPFSDDDAFRFATFKSAGVRGNNEIAPGKIDITVEDKQAK